MRFLFKLAFWLALIAFFLPAPRDEGDGSTSVNYLGAFAGAQEALADLGGFCDRAPTACVAGGEIARFAASRVADGVAYAMGMASPSSPEADETGASQIASTAAPAPRRPAATVLPDAPGRDPMETAAVAADHARRAALASGNIPFAMPRLAAEPAHSPAGRGSPERPVPAAALSPAPSGTLAVPTPAPRA